jgi:hypothetical protein
MIKWNKKIKLLTICYLKKHQKKKMKRLLKMMIELGIEFFFLNEQIQDSA